MEILLHFPQYASDKQYCDITSVRSCYFASEAMLVLHHHSNFDLSQAALDTDAVVRKYFKQCKQLNCVIT